MTLTELGRRADQVARERAQLRNRNIVLDPSANAQSGICERTQHNRPSPNNLTAYEF